MGQRTCRASVSTGADRSEPQRPPALSGGGGTAMTGSTVRGGTVRGVPRVRVCQGQCQVRAVNQCRRVHIRRWLQGQAGAGSVPRAVPDSARASARNSAIMAITGTHQPAPDIRHPTSDTRHPASNVPQVYCYSVPTFIGSPLAISDLWLNLLGGPVSGLGCPKESI